ncbi:insulinase family protein [Streptomyces fimicarius]|uniref:insulinase family protein n=1 Tax=Streptomyces TaxID=1883 RepID=UPI0020BE2A2A|nr:insulinase family protein [Streptomyces sp. 43Y-GA-1]MCL6290264.1 insulinase family protein [Streptomyces sp. 43Y-GA-1]
MNGEIFRLPGKDGRVVVVHRPGSPTTSVIATYALGFGLDPTHAPGTAHLYEHLFLATLRALMTAPVMARAQTDADTMSVSATVPAEAGQELIAALAATPRTLAAGPIDDDVRLRECRAIDVELSEWFGNPLLVAGHKLAALATRRTQPARFDECRAGACAAIAPRELQAHAALQGAASPERLVIVGPSPAEEWLPLANLLGPLAPPVVHVTSSSGWGCLGSRGSVPGADRRVYIGIPLPLSTAEKAESLQLAAEAVLHGRGPLAEVGDRVGARFRGGSVVPTAGCVVVTGSWLLENSRQREAIGIAVRQLEGRVPPAVLGALADAVPERRRALAATSVTLAEAVDAWRCGYGISPTGATGPDVDEVQHIVGTGWERSVLVGARPARSDPF